MGRLTHADPERPGKPNDNPSPATADPLAPSEGERDGVRGPKSIPPSLPIRTDGSRVPEILARQLRALIYVSKPGDGYRVGRTLRSLRAAGIAAEQVSEPSGQQLRAILRAGGPLLFLRAGTWLVRPGVLALPLSSATGKGLCALGALRVPHESEADTARDAVAWTELFAMTGGDFGPRAVPARSAQELAGVLREPERPGAIAAAASRDGSRSDDPDEHAGAETGALLTRAVPNITAGNALSQPVRGFPEPVALFFDSIAAAALADQEVSTWNDIIRISLEQFRVVHYAPLDVYDDRGLRVL